MAKPKSKSHSKPELYYALSVKQPWAAMIVHGLKTIEVRSWPANRRGLILIHASKSPETNPNTWDLVTDAAVQATAQITGHVIGCVELVECVTYGTLAEFEQDADRHLAGPEWFQPKRYGFVLANPRRVASIRWPGNTNFFGVTAVLRPLRVPKPHPRRTPTRGPVQVVRLPEEGPVRLSKPSRQL